MPSEAHSRSGAEIENSPLAPTLAGLRRLLWVVVAMGLCAGLTYVVPGMARVRPWVAGEGIPIARMFFGDDEDSQLPGFAEAGLVTDTDFDQRTAELLGEDLARNLRASEEEAGRYREGPPESRRAGHDPDRSEEAAGPALRIDPEEYAGATQSIENASALRAFFRALEQTARRKPEAITRVAHYGDSSVAADAITHTARRRLQGRFGDAGHGFILISRGDMHYAHKDVFHRSSDGWKAFSLVRRSLGKDWYGYGGVQVRARAGEYARFGTVDDPPVGGRVSRFELYYQKHRWGPKVQLRVDGETERVINTRAKERQDAWEVIEVPDGSHVLTLKPRGGGVAHLYGVVLERDEPGVVYDSLGLVGARAQRLLNSDATHFQRQIAHRDPDLLVLGFGGNEAGNKWLQLDHYEEELHEVVRVVRGADAEMSCLLFAPLDQAKRNERGRIVTLEALPKIVEVQRKVAKEHGCAFFDTFLAMGGEGSIARWRKTRPRLATSDLRHATPRGYDVIGTLYYKALLKAFAQHLKRE